MGSCLVNPKNRKEFDQIVNSGDSILFLHSHNCSHCKKTLPLLEATCEENERRGGNLNLMECPVNQKHCNELAKEAHLEGVPVTFAIPKGGSITQPKARIEGAQIENLQRMLVGEIQNSSKKSENAQQPSPQHQQRAQVPQRMPPNAGINNDLVNVLNSLPSSPRLGNWDTYGAIKKVPLCSPGSECSVEEAEERFIDFYNAGW